jgi:hypothetical protein
MEELFDSKTMPVQPQYMDSEKASHYLSIPIRKLNLYRSEGLIKAVRCGKGYLYRQSWLDDFMEEYAGYDISNRDKIRAAVNEKRWRMSHA